MPRKWTTLAVTLTAAALTLTSLSMADDDDESPTAKAMETINKKSLALKKITRTRTAFSKATPDDIIKNADDLIAEAKKARAHKEPSEKQKKPYEMWTKLMDDLITKTDEFKGVATKKGVTQAVAKKSYAGVTASCTNCHNEFRVEEE